MDKIKIVYIDDNIDSLLSQYLDEYTDNNDIEYDEIEFNPVEGYEGLLRDSKVRLANIIFADSNLFESANKSKGVFTGEEFTVIMKKYYPFIDVIIITQNELDEDIQYIQKYISNPEKQQSYMEYYEQRIPPKINIIKENIKMYNKILCKLKENNLVDSVIKDKIINSFQGETLYDELTKSDIDDLINKFKDLKEGLDL